MAEAANSEALVEILGDYGGFISGIKRDLTSAGLDPSPYTMDHICYRTGSIEEYLSIKGRLVPQHGEVLIESMIGGRPITIVELHRPISHDSFTVRCIEVPCPKPGKDYASGLEHAELVIGTTNEGVKGNEGIYRFMREAQDAGFKLPFDKRALHKDLNADVSVQLQERVSVKFHQQPIWTVVQEELAEGHVEKVPPGYFGDK